MLPQGTPSDPPHRETIDGLGNRKNELVLELIREHDVQPYEGAVRYLRAALGAGRGCAVVSSSTNARAVLMAAGIAELFEVVIDGVVAEREHLAGKPVPDTFLAGARALGLEPANACLRTRSPAQAGRAGCFGVDCVDPADALPANGANVVAGDLAAGGVAFGNADRLTVIACCALPDARFAREGMPTPRPKDQR